MNLEEEFERNNLINNVSLYELYYQVALASIISKTEENDISYEINLEQALSSLYELIMDIKDLDEADDIFEKELQKQAAMDAVQNFVNEHLELIKQKKVQIEPFINDINEGNFFNVAMIEVCNKQKYKQIDVWKNLITKDLSNQIMNSIHSLEAQNTTNS